MVGLQVLMPNLTKISIGYTKIYFSYEMPIAFFNSKGLVISENIWTRTTGKHLNAINDDKSIRIDNDSFVERLNSLFAE